MWESPIWGLSFRNTIRGFFEPPSPSHFSLDESYTDDLPQISSQENNILTSIFSEEVVLEEINQMEHNKSPGLDGFPAEFIRILERI